MSMQNYNRESGNVFFYIFIGVALFAGLTMAVSQGGRVSSSNLTREQMQLRATEIIDYSDTISKAVGTLRLRGVTLANLRFATPSLNVADYGDATAIDQVNLVFHPNGGSAIYREAGGASVNTGNGPYEFVALNAVAGFGTTCATSTCTDVLMVLGDVRADICRAINDYGDIGDATSALPVDSSFLMTGKFQGTISGASEVLGDEGTSAALAGKSYGCFTNTDDGLNYFYRVLWAR